MKRSLIYRIIAVVLIFSTILPMFSISTFGTEKEETGEAGAAEAVLANVKLQEYKYTKEKKVINDDGKEETQKYTYIVAALLIPTNNIDVVVDEDKAKDPFYFLGAKEGLYDKYKLKYKNAQEKDVYTIVVSNEKEGVVGTGDKNTIFDDRDMKDNGTRGNLLFAVRCDYDDGLLKDIPYKVSIVKNGEEIAHKNISYSDDPVEIDETKNIFQKIWAFLSDIVGAVLGFLERQINNLLLALGDGIVHWICNIVGETVTIDGIIFNNVKKVSIDFWNSDIQDNDNTVVSVMKRTVNHWYPVFKGIAILVYMVVLVYVAIRIMLASTGRDKSKYLEMIKSWIIGVLILFLFPYAMKYSVEINKILVEYIHTMGNVEGDIAPENTETNFLNVTYKMYGTNEFVSTMMGTDERPRSANLMMDIRFMSARNGRIPVTFVYYILIGETIIVLYMYYKRVFMLAFLITIFPLVAMTYTIDKLGDNKSQSFNIWLKEFLINVFVQVFHAATYVIVANAGVKVYMSSGNWLFMVLCFMFLFKGEQILRAIFEAKSSANTIGDMAAAGMAVYGVVSTFNKLLKKDNKEETEEEKEYAEMQKKRRHYSYW